MALLGLARLKLRLKPPRKVDPAFGPMVFMYIANEPSRSYWEAAEWLFPPRGHTVTVSLPGDERGPSQAARDFMLGRVRDFERTIDVARPRLDQVFRRWLGRPVADDLWQDLKLAGFDVQDPTAEPIEWDISFETTRTRWLGISVPFVGDVPHDPVVDT